jgi:DnaK suppressor protein
VQTAAYKQVLENKKRELEDEIIRQRSEGREARTAEVEDPIDAVTSSEGQAAAFELTMNLSNTLEAVRDALARIEDGSYGRCIDCGRPIEKARLDAVPWTPYCREDQEQHDARSKENAPPDIS